MFFKGRGSTGKGTQTMICVDLGKDNGDKSRSLRITVAQHSKMFMCGDARKND